MAKTITLELPDEVYESLEQVSREAGRELEDVAAEWLASRAPARLMPLTDAERRAALDELAPFIGAIESGDPRSADNWRIDEDLATDAADPHDGR